MSAAGSADPRTFDHKPMPEDIEFRPWPKLESRAEDPDTAGLRKELLQVAAVAVAWVEDLDSRASFADVHDLGGEG